MSKVVDDLPLPYKSAAPVVYEKRNDVARVVAAPEWDYARGPNWTCLRGPFVSRDDALNACDVIDSICESMPWYQASCAAQAANSWRVNGEGV